MRAYASNATPAVFNLILSLLYCHVMQAGEQLRVISLLWCFIGCSCSDFRQQSLRQIRGLPTSQQLYPDKLKK